MGINQSSTTPRSLNPVQLMLLKLFDRDLSEQEIQEIRELLLNYLDVKLQKQVTKDMLRKNITQTDLDNLLKDN